MTGQRPDDDTTPGEVRVPLVEEVARVSTRERVTGRIRISTGAETREQLVRAALRTDAVEVTRVAVNRQVDIAPAVRTEGDVTIVPVLEEVLVVEKRLMLKEELHIRRTTATETVEETVLLRRQQATVERLDGDAEAEPGA